LRRPGRKDSFLESEALGGLQKNLQGSFFKRGRNFALLELLKGMQTKIPVRILGVSKKTGRVTIPSGFKGKGLKKKSPRTNKGKPRLTKN